MLSDLRFTLRSLRKSPVLVCVIVLSLALGIGANATVICWLEDIVMTPLPGIGHQQQIVVLKSNNGGGNISYQDSKDFAAMKDIFVDGEVSQLGPVFLESEGSTEWVYGQIVSSNFFDVLEIRPLLGRTFLPDEDKNFGGNPVIVIGEELWKRRFGSDPSIVGRTVLINRHPVTIIGVVTRRFRGTMSGLNLEFWAPLSMRFEFFNYGRDYVDWRGSRPWHNLFRLQKGVDLHQAQAAINAIDARLNRDFSRSNKDTSHLVLPLSKNPNGAQALLGPALVLMLSLSLMVHLIVCANVTNLILARTISRGKELAIRLATGASRFQLARLLMVESFVLSTLGGLGGLLLASWSVKLIGYFIPSTDIPAGSLSYTLNFSTIAAISILTVLTGFLVGLAPVFHAGKTGINEALKENGRSLAGSSHHVLRNSLVIVEIALSLVLLVSAALCIKGLKKAEGLNPGFEPKGVLLARISIGMQGYDQARGIDFYSRLQTRLLAIPGVKQSSLGSFFPLGFEGCKGSDASTPGRERKPGEDITYERTLIAPHFFETLGMQLLAGRDFNDADDDKAPPVVIINQAVAERFWPGQDPLGRLLTSHGRQHRVVGVVHNIKFYRMDETPRCHLYFPYRQGVSELDLGICLRVDGDPKAYFAQLNEAVHELDPIVDVRRVSTYSDYALAALFASRLASSMLLILGIVALSLASMGIYAVMAYTVGQRTQEFGVRMALGAGTGSILRLVLRQGMMLAACGIVIGLGLACFAGTGLSSFLYGVSPFDPLVFVITPLMLSFIATLASFVPALHAASLDPMQALRTE
jgi:predicted permease